jgi:hypothetical protein
MDYRFFNFLPKIWYSNVIVFITKTIFNRVSHTVDRCMVKKCHPIPYHSILSHPAYHTITSNGCACGVEEISARRMEWNGVEDREKRHRTHC